MVQGKQVFTYKNWNFLSYFFEERVAEGSDPYKNSTILNFGLNSNFWTAIYSTSCKKCIDK